MIDIRLDIRTLLRFSVYAAEYYGLIHLILDIFAFGGSIFGIWSGVFNNLFTTGLAVTLLLGLRAVVETLLPDDSPTLTEPVPQDWCGKMGWVLDRPRVMFRAGVYIVPLIGMLRLVFDLLASRNAPPAQIWAGLFFSLFTTFES